ncbi:hypothetical protein FB440_104111 [Vibrio crassostreae]|uniref:hypothetical protein n=1 Tax=Vibrio crassostreae TaxID=246167 RepID=UPI00119C092C|nr:hypothetical protein [Vibrio crassostreae]TWD40948.1 hypothetical protein FB440_104111 [Vibrio crassostreae]
MNISKLIVNNWLVGISLAIPMLVNARPQFAQETIQLSATIPSAVVAGNIVSYPLDGDFRRLAYNRASNRFGDISFNVRSELDLSDIPSDYSFIQTYNNLSCYGGAITDSFEMSVKINNKPMVLGRVDLTDSSVWYRGADKYYSDVAVELSSPVVGNETQKWCVGRLSLLVSKII